MLECLHDMAPGVSQWEQSETDRQTEALIFVFNDLVSEDKLFYFCSILDASHLV